ncbi:uncharacterized protein LOC143265472, partial [Megachile rotundata]|uniref:uncharacterized protein LOC143265472 n=1 Tax=Megachile rotundata TaxID=143995 RepID=UPI003FD63E8D
LDVYGFRIWKIFAPKISDTAITLQININLYVRDNVLKLQSLIHNQLSVPLYFSVLDIVLAIQCNEDVVAFKCSWCKEHSCFKHFFIEFHYYENYPNQF